MIDENTSQEKRESCMNNKFQMITVGQLLEENIKSYDDHVAIDFWGGGAGMFTIYIDNPLKSELKEILEGKVTIGLMPIKFTEPEERRRGEFEMESTGFSGRLLHQFWNSLDATFIFLKFGNMPWLEAPFHIALCLDKDMQETGFKIPDEGMGYSMQVIVVNATNGIVEGLRVFACPREFCLLLQSFTETQIKTTKKIGFDRDEYDKWIFKLYRQFSTDQLAEKCKRKFEVVSKRR